MDQINNPTASNINWVLMGKTGSGKSAVGNTLLGRKAFLSKKSPTSVTKEVQVEHGTVHRFPITVYDTPGFFDTGLKEEEIAEKCQSVFSQCESDLTVFLLVIKADRFTEEERRTVEKIEKLLGQNRLEKTWILFTRGDELEEENQTIKEFISKTPELKMLVEKFQNRFHVFNNKLKDSFEQVGMLLLQVIKKCFKKTAKHLARKRPKITASNRCRSSERRIVLLGKSGVGKSATGNTILGKRHFQSMLKMSSVTQKSKRSHAADGKVCVVDTPGLCDTHLKVGELVVEMARSIYLCSPGPHAFLIVLPVNCRFTSQEQEIIQQIEMIFGDEVAKYAIILFTHGDQLDTENVHELIQENKDLSELVQLCGNRYHVFNNKDKNNRQQVTDLLDKIDRMVEKNGGSCYSNEMFEDAARYRLEEEKRVRREEEERVRREEEERKQTKQQQGQEEIERVKKETEDRVRAEMERDKNETMERVRAEMERDKNETMERVRAEMERDKNETMERSRAEMERDTNETMARFSEEMERDQNKTVERDEGTVEIGNSIRERMAPKPQLETNQIEQEMEESIKNETDKGFKQFMSKYWKYILASACIGGVLGIAFVAAISIAITVPVGIVVGGAVGAVCCAGHYKRQTKKKS